MKVVYILLLALLGQCSSNSKTGTGDTDASVRINYWITKGDETALLQKQPEVGSSSESNNLPFIDIDTSKTYQAMDGFGYTLTGGSAWVINKMEAGAKAQLLKELFGRDENSIAISYLRVSIGASDLNASVFSYNDLPAGQTDTAMEKFSLDPDKADLIPLLKEILAINPDIKILGSPWSPPVWMKDNGSSKGGSLKKEFYPAYAKYFVRYVQEMKKEGITIDAITPQNEPLHPGNNPSLLMLAQDQAEFIRDHLGPKFKSAGITTKIIVYDHNCDRPDYPITVLNDPGAKAFVDGSAFHLYAGDISAMSQVHDAHPDKNIYFTEQYTAIESKFDEDLKWHLKNLIIGAPRNWAKTVLEWNLANDASFGPHTDGGCTTCKGALTIDGSNVKRNVAYYIIAHASKFVPAGSVRIESSNSGAIHTVAYKTPSNNYVLIALNEGGSDARFNIRINNKWATVALPGSVAATFVF
jgi:glucosylceramidase